MFLLQRRVRLPASVSHLQHRLVTLHTQDPVFIILSFHFILFVSHSHLLHLRHFTGKISSSSSFLLWDCLLLCLLPALKQQPPGLVSKNNVRFVSKNPWYVLATGSKNSAFPPCPTKHTHTLAHRDSIAISLCFPLSLFFPPSISYLSLYPFLSLSQM